MVKLLDGYLNIFEPGYYCSNRTGTIPAIAMSVGGTLKIPTTSPSQETPAVDMNKKKRKRPVTSDFFDPINDGVSVSSGLAPIQASAVSATTYQQRSRACSYVGFRIRGTFFFFETSGVAPFPHQLSAFTTGPPFFFPEASGCAPVAPAARFTSFFSIAYVDDDSVVEC
ncbi:hypothetical protein IFM89_028275 [Coptis chinensis]|uniref:Uncharacterized protein n=1 Tax=Coptis chinensis TaxID=261450 RepID=A0A835HF18_9MAGN|nr:hypothetical protein IFM89_028275 [Coptis chinensis]